MDTVSTVLRVAVSLGVVVALLWFVQRKSAKWSRKKMNRAINVVAKQSLGSKANLVVVETEGSRFVLGVTEHNVSVIASSKTVSFAGAMAAATPSAKAQAPARPGSPKGEPSPTVKTAPKTPPAKPRVAEAKPSKSEETEPTPQASVGKPGFVAAMASTQTWKAAAKTVIGKR